MTPLTNAEILQAAMPAGLRRVVIETTTGDDGFARVALAVPPQRAIALGIVPDVVFVRNDGWSLGARRIDQGAAARLWPNDWAAMVVLEAGKIMRFKTAVLPHVE